MPKLLNRLAHLEAIKKTRDDAPRYYLNFAGRDCSRVRANGVLLERGQDETPEAFQERIEAQRNGEQFLMVNSALTEEEWVAEVAEHYRKHPVGQPWQE